MTNLENLLNAFLPKSLTNHNVRLLFLQRFVRLYAYGSSTLILAHFFMVLRNSPYRTGLFMTLTLYGDVVISLLLTLFADRLGRRNILLLGATLMIMSGITFALVSNFWILLLAAVFGVISPAGNEIGPFRAIEESITAQLVEGGMRTEVFAWFTLIGALGSALGSVSCGWLVNYLVTGDKGASEESAYRVVFWIYSAVGLVKLALTWELTEECEVVKSSEGRRESLLRNEHRGSDRRGEGEGESESLLRGGRAGRGEGEGESLLRNEHAGSRRSGLLRLMMSGISTESLSILWKLCLLFAVDSAASGLAPASWLTYFFTTKHKLNISALGILFFTTSLLAATSSLLAVPISKRLGLIRTMVYTHLPSAIFLAMIPIPGRSHVGTGFAMSFLIVRSLMASMDQAPRTAFLTAVMMPEERTAVMGVVNTVKTFSQGVGPLVTGWLGGKGKMGAAFFIAGLMKISYDLGLLAFFLRGETSQRIKNGDQGQEASYKSDQGEEGNVEEETAFLVSSDDGSG